MANILGWIIIGLMVGALIKYLKPSHFATTVLRKNAPLIAVIVTVNVMSALDALSTVFLIAHGFSNEMNPVMDALMNYSYALFFVVKMLITLTATLICWHYYERKRRARTILKLTSRIYCALLAWHCLLLSSVLL